MLVHLQQYKHEEVQFDDNRTTGQSQTEDSVETESAEYFGEDIEEFSVETWETVEYEGEPIQRRDLTIGGVSAVSVPERSSDTDQALPGRTVQVRARGDIDTFEQTTIVEVQDENPRD